MDRDLNNQFLVVVVEIAVVIHDDDDFRIHLVAGANQVSNVVDMVHQVDHNRLGVYAQLELLVVACYNLSLELLAEKVVDCNLFQI